VDADALQATLRALVEENHDAIFVKDLAGRYVLVNSACARAAGRTVEQVVGLDDDALFEPALALELKQTDQMVISTGRSLQFESIFKVEGGSRVYQTSKHMLLDAEGRPFGVIGIGRDVTEARRAAEELRQSRSFLEQAQAVAKVGSWTRGLQPGDPVAWSKETYRIFGVAPDVQPTLEMFLGLVHPDDRAKVMGNGQTSIERDASLSTEHRIVRADGQVRWVHERASILHDTDGKPLRLLGTVQDVTEAKELQAHRLMTDRMVTMGTLAAGIGHEINNPLTFVTSNLFYIQRELERIAREVPEVDFVTLREALADAMLGANRVGAAVSDLRAFSRSDEESVEPVELERIAEAAIAMAMNELRHRARLVRDVRPAPRVRANEARLGQVLLNLLVNAAQSIPEGHVDRHEIRVSIDTTPDGQASIEVSDTGAGMSPELQRDIFTPFFTTKPVGVGTGLGLAISQRIVASLGGTISVSSTPGRGSSFRVVLPAADATPGAPASIEPSAPVLRIRRARVLVVDDEPMILRMFERELGDDHEVVTAVTARAVLERGLADLARFDVIFSDLLMPEMTGMELFAHLGQVSPELQARVVFMTGGAFTPAAGAFLHGVTNECLEKPFLGQALHAIVAARVR
jgi:PAS domain S-box-containing protein